MKQNISQAIVSHLAWTESFRSAIEKKCLTDAVTLGGYDDMCPFGKWLYSLDDAVKRRPAYRLVKDLHYRFHAEAAEIVRLMNATHFGDASAHLAGDYALTSAKLLLALRGWQAAESN